MGRKGINCLIQASHYNSFFSSCHVTNSDKKISKCSEKLTENRKTKNLTYYLLTIRHKN